MLCVAGPPRGTGKQALDYILDKKNVGDSGLNKLIDKASIPFGLFGHILEAGGAAVGADMKSTVSQGKLVNSLHINAGSLSGDPWPMNANWTSYGIAVIFSIEGKNAKYEVKKFKAKPKARNPKTAEIIYVPARRKTHFKPGKLIKNSMKQPLSELEKK